MCARIDFCTSPCYDEAVSLHGRMDGENLKDWKRIARGLAGISLLVVSAFLMLLMVTNLIGEKHLSVYHPSGGELEEIKPYTGLPKEHLFNSGDVKALDALPGVGKVIAERIVLWRDKVGPFIFPEDLMLVKGVGEKRFEDAMRYIAGQEATPTDLAQE